jgi:hypothetical protein
MTRTGTEINIRDERVQIVHTGYNVRCGRVCNISFVHNHIV